MDSTLVELGSRVAELPLEAEGARQRVDVRAGVIRAGRHRRRVLLTTGCAVAVCVLGVVGVARGRSEGVAVDSTGPSSSVAADPLPPLNMGVHIRIMESASDEPAAVVPGYQPAGLAAGGFTVDPIPGGKARTAQLVHAEDGAPGLTLVVTRADVAPELLDAWRVDDGKRMLAAATVSHPDAVVDVMIVDGQNILVLRSREEAGGVADPSDASLVLVAGPDTTIAVRGAGLALDELVHVVTKLRPARGEPMELGTPVAQGTRDADGSCHFEDESPLMGSAVPADGQQSTVRFETDANCTTRYAGTEVAAAEAAPASGTAPSGESDDLYAQSLASIEGPTILPAVAPPGVRWVWLQSLDGRENLIAEYDTVQIHVCQRDRCVPNGTFLREVQVGPDVFRMEYSGEGKSPSGAVNEPALPDDVARFWAEVQWVTSRPSWLTMDHWPGR